MLARATRPSSASPLDVGAWNARESPSRPSRASGRSNAAASTSGVGVWVSTPTSASSMPVPSGVLPGSVVDTLIGPHSGWPSAGLAPAARVLQQL